MAFRNWLTAAGKGILLFPILAVAAYVWTQAVLASGRAMILPVDPAPLVAVTKQGERSFSVEIADEPSERGAGLMFREHMADNHGMLFVFQETGPVSFWMKNTIMPLDLIFIGQDGRIRAIRRGEPYSEAAISADEPVRFVLELKAGIAARNGITEGDMVKHPAISRASTPGADQSD